MKKPVVIITIKMRLLVQRDQCKMIILFHIHINNVDCNISK